MRLRRLDLTRYGKFTDQKIDFGERVEGESDLHIIYGPNEAGKSTALAGFLDLLFGIETQSRYGFMHPYTTMQVGGCLELSIGSRELVRVKRRAASLLDVSGTPVPEGLILGDLGGLDRNAYRTMFSLDDETLEAGGKSILASNGELGQLLFAASAGLSALSSTLQDIRVEVEAFAKPHTRSGELQQLKAALAELKQERDAIDTLAAEYNRLASNRDRTRDEYDAARKEQAQVQAALAGIGRLLAAVPRMAALNDLRQRLVPLAELPEAPTGWLGQLDGLQQAESSYSSQSELATAELRRLIRAVQTLVVDEPALELAGELAPLAELRARSFTAGLDLPGRRNELARSDGEVISLLRQLGHEHEPYPTRLLLNAAQTAQFDELIVARSGIEAQVTAAVEEHAESLQQLADATHALDQEAGGAPPGSLMLVAAALNAVQESDHAARLRSATRAYAMHEAALASRMVTLTPWDGTIETLAKLALPSAADVQAWQRAADRNEASCKQLNIDLEQIEHDVQRRAAELKAIGQTAGLLSDEAAAEIRRAREAAWAEHRGTLNSATADSFEMILRRDDIVANARLRHERDLAKLHEAAQALAVRQADVTHARLKRDTAVADCHLAGERLIRASACLGSEPIAGLSPAWLLGWMTQRDLVLESRGLVLQAEQDIRAAETDAFLLYERLSGAIANAGLVFQPSANLQDLAALATAALQRENRRQALSEAVAPSQQNISRRELTLQKALAMDQTWRDAWITACSSCWLGLEAANLPIAAVRDMLPSAALLGPVLQSRAVLAARIRSMEDDQSALDVTLERLSTALSMATAHRSSAERAHIITQRIENAFRAEQERRSLNDAISQAEEKLRKVKDEALVHARRVHEMTEFMQAGSLMELAGKLRDAAYKVDLKRQAAQTEQEILTALRVRSLEDARAMLDGLEERPLEQEQAELATQLEGLESSTREYFAASKAALDKITEVGGDDTVAKIEERRRTALLDIEEKAQRHLRLRLGIAAADRALRAYRDQHRSSMMIEASEAFRIISCGAYGGLGTQPDKDGDILVAQGADGNSKLATDLSKGTRFQLYLALRAAGYREFAKQRRPVPFIADDIMETFDDHRAQETLLILYGMAGLGQVIYLTHHQHLLPIAQRTVPGVRIHSLR